MLITLATTIVFTTPLFACSSFFKNLRSCLDDASTNRTNCTTNVANQMTPKITDAQTKNDLATIKSLRAESRKLMLQCATTFNTERQVSANLFIIEQDNFETCHLPGNANQLALWHSLIENIPQRLI